MTHPSIQRRLTAHLITAIYAIANALLPIVDAIANQPTRPRQQRARFADRFSTIIRNLLALTARIRPTTLSPNPNFRAAPPRPAPRPRSRPAQRRPANSPATRLSARQLAQRLATLLRQLERLLAEAGTTLLAAIHNHIASARTLAGCAALPSPNPSWERAG